MFDSLKGFGVTFSTMFKKVVTEEYPEIGAPAAPRYHGRHQLNRHPDGLEKCVGCELCAWACPTRSLTRLNEYGLADDNRQDLIWTKDQLLAPLLNGMEQPPHPMRLGESEQDYYVNGKQLARKWGYPDPVGEEHK